MRSQLLIVLVSLTSVSAFAQSSRFSGGLCNSQGTWLKQALDQSETIVAAIKSLKDEPSCTALVAAMENTPDIKEMSKSDLTQGGASMGMMYQDLSAVSNYMRPNSNVLGIPGGDFKKIIQSLVFRKSFDAISDVKARGYVTNMSEDQKNTMNAVSERLRSYLDNSKKIAKASMSTTQNILSALPQSKLCFDRRPSEAATIFGAVVNTMAALTTNGEIDGVGKLIGSIMRYSRESHYMDKMATVEVERFRASVSCLLESTTENYCSLVDGANNLKFLRTEISNEINPSQEILPLQEQIISDPAANKTLFPMVGLNLLMRDAPVVTDWMQRILFGIDPKLDLEAQMKNNNWTSFIENIKKDNTMRANFRDRQSVYLASTKNDDNATKLVQVKDILEGLLDKMDVGTPGNNMNGNISNSKTINFYANFKGTNQMAWFLLGMNGPPIGFNGMNINWDSTWNNWIATGELGNPDALLERIGQNMSRVTIEANRKATSFINARMIVDPLNLVTEAMKGPGISPYAGLMNIKAYNEALLVKFQNSIQANSGNARMVTHIHALKSIIPLLKDTNQSITRILKALDDVEHLATSDNKDENALASKKIMDIIYDSANMMLSRDSYFDTRLRQVVQYDISDTIYNLRGSKETGMSVELENLFARGSTIVNTLSNIFAEDPVVQSLDIAQAMEVQKANLKSTEGLFAKVVFNQIMDINCRLYGGRFCNIAKNSDIDPATDRYPESTNSLLAGAWNKDGVVAQFLNYISPKATDDDPSLQQLRAKLCAQSLAFETRDSFRELCKGARLISEYSGDKDPQNLNMNYDQNLATLKQLEASGSVQWKTDKRNAGVCAFRNYMRRNYVYRMYMDYQQQ